MEKLVYMLLLVGGAFIVGLMCQKQGTQWQQPAAKLATRIALTVCIPVSMLGAMWQMPAFGGQLLLLPLVGVAVLASGAVLGLIFARVAKLTPLEKGALVPVATFYNIGALGGICVFTLFGETGLAMLALFKLFEEVIYFAWALPYARANSDFKQAAKKFTLPNPFIFFTLLALLSGALLNVFDITRPTFFLSLSNILVPAGSFLLVFSLGLSIELKTKVAWRKLTIKMAVLRTLLSPLVGISALLLLGFSFAASPLVFKVVVVLAMMPASFISLIPPVLYGVDRHVASTAWLSSTLVFIISTCCLLILNAFLG